jgi:outer membrane receptor protein involved in Fe transport
VALVDQIQILKSGASSIYGADAVSGVVNVVLRQDFTGTQLNVDGGISAHGDDRSGDIAATEGFNFDHGKGNFVVAGEYNDQGDIIQANRSWAGQVVTAEPAPGGN